MYLHTPRIALAACLVLAFAASCSKKTASGPSAPAPAAAANPGAPTPGPADAALAATKFPGTTLAQLQEGQTLYKANCVRCHELIPPKARTEAIWREVTPPMAQKARIDATTEAKILAYVVTMSQAK
jgi:cytochrome c1